jgi:hypothetical protein
MILLVQKIAAVAAALALSASLAGCAPENREIHIKYTSQPQPPSDQEVPDVPDQTQPAPLPTKLSADDVCMRLVTSYSAYSAVFEDFRYNNGSEDAYTSAVTRFQSEVNRLGSDVLQKGIDWDRASVVKGMLFTMTEDAVEIHNSYFAGQFAPGRDITTLVNEIESRYTAVQTSACRNMPSGDF